MLSLGIPAVQSYIVSGGLYYILIYLKAQYAPDQFTRKSGKKLLQKLLKIGGEEMHVVKSQIWI